MQQGTENSFPVDWEYRSQFLRFTKFSSFRRVTLSKLVDKVCFIALKNPHLNLVWENFLKYAQQQETNPHSKYYRGTCGKWFK